MQRKVIIAAVIATIGLFLAGRALWPVLFPPSRDIKYVEPELSPAAAALGTHLLDTDPAIIGAEAAIDRAAERAASGISAAAGGMHPRAAEDLAAAFRERLQATIDADYERNLAAKIARGKQVPETPLSEAARARWKAGRDWIRNTKLGLEHLEVRWIARDGEAMAPTGLSDGYDVTRSSLRDVFPLPIDPVAEGFDVVEVRLPMGLEPLKGEGRGAVLVGYRFAWHPERRQWVPCKNVIYMPPGRVVYPSLPF